MLKLIRNAAFAIVLITAGCSKSIQHVRYGNTDSLAGLEAMVNTTKPHAHDNESMSKIREMALKEAALSLGAQAGLAYRSKLINNQLTKQARYFDSIFNFNALVLEHNIQPPVLLEAKNTFNLANETTIRLSDQTYRIAKQAHFITTPLNWRQYLWLDFKKPEYPNQILLPTTHAERQVWSYYVQKGWKKGKEQADIIFAENVARIKEEFGGMILYRKLLAMNIVSPPYVSHTDLGVTGDDAEIHIDDRVLRITELPALNTNSNNWRAAVAKNEDALKQFRQMEHLVEKSKIVITSDTWQPIITPTH